MAKHVEQFIAEADFSDLAAALESAAAGFRNLTKAEKQTERELKKVEKTTEKGSKNLEGLKFAAQGAGGRVGELAGRAENMGRAFVTLNPLLLAGGVAVVGVGAAALTAAASVAAFTTGVVSLVRASDELLEATEPFREVQGFVVSDEEIAQLDRANAALDSLTTVASQVGVELATAVGPAAERVATLLAAVGLVGLDTMQALGDATSETARLFRIFLNSVLAPFEMQMRNLAKAAILFQETFGGPVSDSLREAAEGGDAVSLAFGLADQGMTELEGATGNYLQRASDLIDVQVGVNAEMEAAEKASRGAADGLKEQVKALEALAAINENAVAANRTALETLEAGYAEQLSSLDEIAAKLQGFPGIEQEIADARAQIEANFFRDRFNLAAEEAEKMAAMQREQNADEIAATLETEQEKDAIRARFRQAAIQGFETLTSAFIDGASRRNKAFLDEQEAEIDAKIANLEAKDTLNGKEAAALERFQKLKGRLALFDFRREKAANIAKAVMAGASLAITSSLPPPSGIGFPQGAVAAAAVTGAQVTAILAQKAPTFHTGGIIRSTSDLAPDEVSITAQPDEAVLNRETVRQIGEQGVRDLNSGVQRGGGAMQVILDGETMERAIVRRFDGDGPLGGFRRGDTPGITRGFGSG